MQNRRLLYDDDAGLGESLNETEADGAGLRVNAKYFMQIFDLEKGASLQRKAQLLIQGRPQYLFTDDFKFSKSQQNRFLLRSSPRLKIDDQMTYRLFPVSKGKVLVRFENMQDRFDLSPKHQNLNVNIYKFARSLY